MLHRWHRAAGVSSSCAQSSSGFGRLEAYALSKAMERYITLLALTHSTFHAFLKGNGFQKFTRWRLA